MLLRIGAIFHTWLLLQVISQDLPTSQPSNTKNNVSLVESLTESYISTDPDMFVRTSCLTGFMTDIQNWVDAEGELTDNIDPKVTLDLSGTYHLISALEFRVKKSRGQRPIKYISMAKCRLNSVPMAFQLKLEDKTTLADTVEYLTMYGNDFYDFNEAGEHYDVRLNASYYREVDVDLFQKSEINSEWAAGFKNVALWKLKELDLRHCRIQLLCGNIFSTMVNLEALYLGGNHIKHISDFAFNGLYKLVHLDLSENSENEEVMFIEINCSFDLPNLKSLDFSHTKLDRRSLQTFLKFSKNLERLSICHTGINKLQDAFFADTRIRYLDVSGNTGILTSVHSLDGLERTLEVLYAEEIGIRSADMFQKFSELDVLKLSKNELSVINAPLMHGVKNLRILDLSNNRLGSWSNKLYRYASKLEYLSLRNNNLNVITDPMLDDFISIPYLALSGNRFVCSCHSRDLFELALRNEFLQNLEEINPRNISESDIRVKFTIAYREVNKIILERDNLTKYYCDDEEINCSKDIEVRVMNDSSNGTFLLVDYNSDAYKCIMVGEGMTVSLRDVGTCLEQRNSFPEEFQETTNKLLALITIPIVLFVLLTFGYIFRWNIRYCYITMRNSTMLSLISKEDANDAVSIYTYDVFISYCNDDRDWVLDYLLPHLEEECNVSVCLHERDFQVGLSILENIVSCMDRSRSILLIISKKFLLSQWCQFEMHLAQHRLLETRREDLILVLLEDIPRRSRPTTLHYLMVTKTYIVWPKSSADQVLFWRRLHNSLLQYKLKESASNMTLA